MKINVSPYVKEEAIKNSRLKMKIVQESSKAIWDSRTKDSEEIKFCDKDLRLKIFYRVERRQKVILAHGA
jgi:hypothetical protein